VAYERESEVARTAARAAGEILLRHYQTGTTEWQKSADNPVTLADLESEREIVCRLRENFPNDCILSEESARDPERGAVRRVWIVDPMDGTKEFVSRIPEFAISIALVADGIPIVGVIHNPTVGIEVSAVSGGGTYRNGERTRVSRCSDLAQAVVIASRSEIGRGEFKAYEGWFRELRPVGSIAWKLACIAGGDADLNVSVAPKNEWDVCAGDLLVREAGGIYCAFDGGRRRYNQPNTLIAVGMAAGPPALVTAFGRRWQQAQNPLSPTAAPADSC